MPVMCRSKQAEKAFRGIMGDPANASKKFSVKAKKQTDQSKVEQFGTEQQNTSPFNTTYSMNNQDVSYERE